MADTKISGATDGVTFNATDKIPIARSGLTSKLWITGTYIQTFLNGLANTWVGNQTFSGAAIAQKPVAANSSTAYTIDQANGAQFDITLNGVTPVLTLQAVTASQYQELAVTLIQDGSGGRVPSWANVTWAAGVAPAVASAIAARTYLKFISDGTTWTGYAVPASTGTGLQVLANSPTVATPSVSGNITQTSAAGTLVLKQGSNGKCGTFVANGITPVTVNNSSIAITDTIIISLNTIGGTVGVQPHVATITASSGFTVVCTATDSSTYNYAIISNAA